MNINMKSVVPVLLILAFFIYGVYDMSESMSTKKFLEVEGKTSDGKIIDINDVVLHATIGEQYGIKEIRFTINVKNTGETPLTISILSLSPIAL